MAEAFANIAQDAFDRSRCARDAVVAGGFQKSPFEREAVQPQFQRDGEEESKARPQQGRANKRLVGSVVIGPNHPAKLTFQCKRQLRRHWRAES